MKDFIINEKSERLLQLYNENKWREIVKLFEYEFYDQRFLWVRPTLENLSFIGEEVGDSLLVSIGCGCGLLEWLISRATGADVIGLEVDRQWWESRYAPPAFLTLFFTDEVETLSPYINGASPFNNDGGHQVNGSPHINGSNLHANESTPHTDERNQQINGSTLHLNGSTPHINGNISHINGSIAHVNGSTPHINGSTSCIIESNRHINGRKPSINCCDDPQIDSIKTGNKTTLLFCYFNNRPAFENYVSCYEGSCIIIIGPGKGQGNHTDPEPFDAKLPSDWSISRTQPMTITGDYVVVYRRK